MKYKLSDIQPNGLYRIIALRDFGDVRVGDIGGYVSSEKNLSQSGSCWVFDDAEVTGDAHISDNAHVRNTAKVFDKARVFGAAKIFDKAHVTGNAQVTGNAHVAGNAGVSGNARVADFACIVDNAYVTDNCTISKKAIVCDNAVIRDSVTITDHAKVSQEALVKGNAHIGTNLHIKFGVCSKTPSITDMLKLSIGVASVNGIVRLYKRINLDMTSEYDKTFVYPSSGEVICDNFNADPTVSCAGGLHFSHVNYSVWLANDSSKILVADIHVDDIICVQEGKVRCTKATIVGVAD